MKTQTHSKDGGFYVDGGDWEGMEDYIGEYEIKTVNNLIKQSLRKTIHFKYSGRKTEKQTQVTDKLVYISTMNNDNVVAGGSILATSLIQ